MLETFTVETFSPHLGEPFRVVVEDTSLDLTLHSAGVYGTESAREWSKSSGREPFTLTFLGPEDRVIQQAMYTVEHPQIGAFQLFLVPIGPVQQGMRYEAIFT